MYHYCKFVIGDALLS